jgi:quinol monooxygenase YgiN
MTVRIVLTISAIPGKALELAAAYRTRCEAVLKEAGCEQFEVFQGVADPNRFVVLERWTDVAALDAHAQLNAAGSPGLRALCVGRGEREDYAYNRTR